MQNIVIKSAIVAILFSSQIQANTTPSIHDPISREDDALTCALYAAIASINMPTSSLKSNWNSKSYTWLEHAADLGKNEETSPKTINKTVEILRKQPKNKLMNFSVEAYKSANCYQVLRRKN